MQDRVPLTANEVQTLERNLQKLLKDEDCGKFINAMLDSLPSVTAFTSKYGDSLMDNFGRIKKGGGFWSGDLKGKALAETDPNILRMTWETKMTPQITGELWQQLGVALLLVHELTHLFTKVPRQGAYGHFPMAQAAASAAEIRKIDVGKIEVRKGVKLEFPLRQNYATDYDYDVALSSYYGNVLGYACRKVNLK